MRRYRVRYVAAEPRIWRRRAWLSLGITALLMGAGIAALTLHSVRPVWEPGRQAFYFDWDTAESPIYTCTLPGWIPPDWNQLPQISTELPPQPPLEALLIQPTEAPLAAQPELPPDTTPIFEWPTEESLARPAAAPRAERRAKPPAPRQATAPQAAAGQHAATPREEGSYTPPAYRSAPLPPYPAAMRQSRLEGSVRLRLFLDAEGRPERVELVQSSGHAEFDATAQAWVLRHWVFSPARQNERAVPSTVVTSVQFVLN